MYRRRPRLLALVLLSLVTSLAHATEVTFGMKGITINVFREATDTVALRLYQLKASRHHHYVEDIENPFKGVFYEQSSSTNNHYIEGSLRFLDGSSVDFEKGYFFKGQLKMLGVRGFLNGASISTKQMVYDKRLHKLTSERISIKKSGLKLKSNFEFYVPLGQL